MPAPRAPFLTPGYRIILLCIGAAVAYGLIMDQITARVCLEYFTVAHPPVSFLPKDSPTIVAIYWGFAATWWVGLILGTGLAAAARAGSWPQLGPREVRKPVAFLLLVMAAGTTAAGFWGYHLSASGKINFEDWKWAIPRSAYHGFVADAFAHLTSYAIGFFGGIVLIVLTLKRRRRMAGANATP